MKVSKALAVFLLTVAPTASSAQSTVFVAPAPQPGDPTFFSYQLNQVGQILRRNALDAAQIDALQSQTELNRALAAKDGQAQINELIALAQLLDMAGTPEQKQTLQQLVQQKLDSLVSPLQRTLPPGTVLVAANAGFEWAAEQIARSLQSSAIATDSKISEVKALAAKNPNIVGYVEVEVEPYKAFELSLARCYSSSGALRWEERVRMASPGRPDAIAREHIGRLSRKVAKRSCP